MEKKVIPLCVFCEEQIKTGQKVYLNNLNQLPIPPVSRAKKALSGFWYIRVDCCSIRNTLKE
jgi:hypothetical protein